MPLTSKQIAKIKFQVNALQKLTDEAEKAQEEAVKQRKIKVSRKSEAKAKYSQMYATKILKP